MYEWLFSAAPAAAVCAAVYLLYRRGSAVTRRVAAVLFVFRHGRDADRVTLNSCTGWVRHAGRFRGDRTYVFVLDAELSGGSAEAALLDGKKRQLMKLDRQTPAGRIETKPKERYVLRWAFRDATGRCELRWQEEEKRSATV